MRISLFLLVTLIIIVMLVFTIRSGHSQSVKHWKNGWYRIIDGQNDSIITLPIITVKEFVGLRLDKDFFGKSVIVGNISKHKL